MSALTIKRIIVLAISTVVGFVLGLLIITVGFDLLPLFSAIQTPQGVSIEEYGYIYFAFTFIPLSIVVMIWLDAFAGTKMLSE